MFKNLEAQRLLALFFFSWLLLNFPLLGLWDRDVAGFGIPVLFIGLFTLWGVMIVVLAWLMERSDRFEPEE